MGKYPKDELEDAFRKYWRTGAVGESWDAWADLFSEDCVYLEHMYGEMRGRETVRTWIKPIMEKYGELYTKYDWHAVDPDGGRVVFYMQNRRDHPSGHGTIDFPGISILEYAGNGKWSKEEDFWSVKGRDVAMREYAEACTKYDPDHTQKRTRFDWGNGPDWTRGARTFFDRK